METLVFAMNSVDCTIQIAHLTKKHWFLPSQSNWIHCASLSFSIDSQFTLFPQTRRSCGLEVSHMDSAFYRIRSPFDDAANDLNVIYQNLSPNPIRKFLIASHISYRIDHLEADVSTLQRDLHLLGFFTASTQTSAFRSTTVLSNVNDVQQSVANMEVR